MASARTDGESNRASDNQVLTAESDSASGSTRIAAGPVRAPGRGSEIARSADERNRRIASRGIFSRRIWPISARSSGKLSRVHRASLSPRVAKAPHALREPCEPSHRTSSSRSTSAPPWAACRTDSKAAVLSGSASKSRSSPGKASGPKNVYRKAADRSPSGTTTSALPRSSSTSPAAARPAAKSCASWIGICRKSAASFHFSPLRPPRPKTPSNCRGASPTKSCSTEKRLAARACPSRERAESARRHAWIREEANPGLFRGTEPAKKQRLRRPEPSGVLGF